MRVKITTTGNSLAIHLPKPLARELDLQAGDEVLLNRQAQKLVVEPVRQPRQGWAEQFAAMAAAGDDNLLLPDVLGDEDWDDL